MKQRALKVVIVIVGLLFTAGIYPLVMDLRNPRTPETEPMFLSLYVTLGIFLLRAVRNPSAHRSVIQYAAWSSFAHAATMVVQGKMTTAGRAGFFEAATYFGATGALLVAFRPAKGEVARASAV